MERGIRRALAKAAADGKDHPLGDYKGYYFKEDFGRNVQKLSHENIQKKKTARRVLSNRDSFHQAFLLATSRKSFSANQSSRWKDSLSR